MNRLLSFIFVTSSILTLSACGSSSSSSGGASGGGGGSNAPGAFLTSGGVGGDNGGTGGAGGNITINKVGGVGAIEVLRTGNVDSSFTVPAYVPTLGSVPLVVSTNTEINVDPATSIAAGEAYQLTGGDEDIYLSDGDNNLGNDFVVTGIHVQPGATLTFGLNFGGYAAPTLIGDVHNEGVITALDVSPAQRGGLLIRAENYFATGDINTNGTLDAQHGGPAQITVSAKIINTGSINTSGANSSITNAGDGGNINLVANLSTVNTGALTSSGGTSTNGNGGDAGFFEYISSYSSVFNSGQIIARGGDGSTGGGSGHGVNLIASFDAINGTGFGTLINNGLIDGSGGNATTSGNGGDIKGSHVLTAFGGRLVSTGSIMIHGGDTADIAGTAGDGSDVAFLVAPGNISPTIPTSAGSLFHQGLIDMRGGNAPANGSGTGGAGGNLDINLNAHNNAGTGDKPTSIPPVTLGLYGITDLISEGGSGNTGGNGGAVSISHKGLLWNGASFLVSEFGATTNEANIFSVGGSVPTNATTPAMGGTGGFVGFSPMDENFENPVPVIGANYGDINSSGGNSLGLTSAPGSNAGQVSFTGIYGSLQNYGNVIANGGNDLIDDNTLATGFGHAASNITMILLLNGDSINEGNFTANGGDGEAEGGNAAYAYVWPFFMGMTQATEVNNTGSHSAQGGNADAGVAGSVGGDGSLAGVQTLGACSDTGVHDVSAGAGATPGAAGTSYTC